MSKFEILKENKVAEYIQQGKEFFVVDMEKKKVYSSNDLRLGELAEKLDNENVFLVKECSYS